MDYKAINKNSWNRKTEIHMNSDFYDNENFIKGKSSLNSIEIDLLGDVKGKSILHLQCHFGQDTISLSRMGATTTGVDLSDKAVEKARELAVTTSQTAKFVNCDIYDLPNHLDEKFDIVYTSYGTIGWLPDMDRWAKIVSQYLKPNGKFVFVEFHPIIWMFEDSLKTIKFPYSSTEPIYETEKGTYADSDNPGEFEYVMWNHGIADVMGNLLKNGLTINSMDEYNYSPYDIFENSEEVESKRFKIKHFKDKFPLVYSIVATKN